jgi:hypothetical protein
MRAGNNMKGKEGKRAQKEESLSGKNYLEFVE